MKFSALWAKKTLTDEKWYARPMHEKFHHHNCSETRNFCGTKMFGSVRQKSFDKFVIPLLSKELITERLWYTMLPLKFCLVPWQETISMENMIPSPFLLSQIIFSLLQFYWETDDLPYQIVSFIAVTQNVSNKAMMPSFPYAWIFKVPFFWKREGFSHESLRHCGTEKHYGSKTCAPLLNQNFGY